MLMSFFSNERVYKSRTQGQRQSTPGDLVNIIAGDLTGEIGVPSLEARGS